MTGHTFFPRSPTRRGFTLIELLVVIAIIAVLATLAFPAVRSFIDKGNQAKCAANLRQIGSGMQGFVADNNGTYPLLRGYTRKGPWEGPFWADHLEPYTGSESSPDMRNKKLTSQSCCYCPSTPNHHPISDYGINGNVIISPANSTSVGLRAALVTQPSQTILAVDAGQIQANTKEPIGTWTIAAAWYQNPPPEPWTGSGPVPRHGNQLNVLFCDGRVQAMTYKQLLELHPKAFEVD
jgi:prepilin-type N-terminal cleavage/methylation domain-containing protein/prepilin-type processing-associated H-X9-DG protein